MQNINPPKTRKQLQSFISMVNYYRDMWWGRLEILASLMELNSKKVKFTWNNEHQKIFNAVKRVIGREVLLAYPYFIIPLEKPTQWPLQRN